MYLCNKWLADLEPGQDGYGNEDDRAESGDQLSDEDESDEDEVTHAVPCIQVHLCCSWEKLPISFGTGIPYFSWTRWTSEYNNMTIAIESNGPKSWCLLMLYHFLKQFQLTKHVNTYATNSRKPLKKCNFARTCLHFWQMVGVRSKRWSSWSF